MSNWMEKLARLIPVLALLAVLFGGLALTQSRLNRIRTDENLTMATPLENAPPVVAFTTVALGGFRGLLADWLWLRSRRLQDEGNYFEMVQLGNWIVKLQPRFTGATAFLAWNMSYNISVTFSDFEDRWRWVRRGIELIRDEALQYNPGDPDLYYELAWIYRHKVGQKMDDANRYYKTEMARDIMRILGTYPPDWSAWQQTPDKLEDLRADLPEAAPAWSVLDSMGMDLRDLETRFRADGEFPDELRSGVSDPAALQALERVLRKRWLHDEYKLEPALVRTLNATYGELDWRLPQAHAIYWAYQGLQRAEGEMHTDCERLITHALNQAFYEGRLLYVKEGNEEYLDLSPNIDVVDVTLERHRQNLLNHPDNSGFRAGFKNFLIDAIVVLYTYGEDEKAQQVMDEGREQFGREFRGSVERFALRQLAKDIREATQAQAAATVRGYLFQACRSLAFGDYDRAGNFENLAHSIWRRYMADAAGTENQRKRRGLPPYSQMKQNTVDLCLKQFAPTLAARLKAAIGTLQGDEEQPTTTP